MAIKSYTEEHLILLECRAEEISVRDIMDEFGLISYRDYIARCTEYRNQALARPTSSAATG